MAGEDHAEDPEQGRCEVLVTLPVAWAGGWTSARQKLTTVVAVVTL